MSTHSTDQISSSEGQRRTTRRSGYWVSPGRVLGALSGAVLVLVGALAVLDAKLDSTFATPLSDVWGLSMGAGVGLAALLLGILLLSTAATEYARSSMTLLGGLVALLGLVMVAVTNDVRSDAGFDTATGWFFMGTGLVAAVASLIPSAWHSSREERITG